MLRWIKRLLIAIVGLVLVAALAGFTYQSLATRLDLGRTPAPGRLVDIGGHRLHIWCSGSGAPSVILETGLGGTTADWGLVQPEVANFTNVCSYDRAGMGYSDPGPTPRTLARINSELTQLLDRAGVTGPVVLVGASIGGLSARLLASEHPDRVAGLVLLDPSSEDEAPHVPPVAPYVPLYSSLGIFRLRGVTFGPSPASQPPATRQFAEATSRRTAAYTTTLDEITHLPEGLAEVKATRRPLTNPLVVLTAGRGSEAAWLESQRGQAALSSRGCQVIAENSGHGIAVGQPDIVIRAIQSVVDAARGHSDASICAERPGRAGPTAPRH
jgi:pimeloyl-ACP methyl ester carboxylesterase